MSRVQRQARAPLLYKWEGKWNSIRGPVTQTTTQWNKPEPNDLNFGGGGWVRSLIARPSPLSLVSHPLGGTNVKQTKENIQYGRLLVRVLKRVRACVQKSPCVAYTHTALTICCRRCPGADSTITNLVDLTLQSKAWFILLRKVLYVGYGQLSP